jgi:predicted small metal-binding protein
MPDVEYMLFCCRDVEHPCGFSVQAKTKEEAMEHARAHMAREHDMEEIPKETERKIEESIKPVKVEE